MKRVEMPWVLVFYTLVVTYNKLLRANEHIQLRSIISKHNAIWLNVLKTNTAYSFQKSRNVNKTHQLKPGKGAGICGQYYKLFTAVIMPLAAHFTMILTNCSKLTNIFN
jgi:hypothetical protein